MSVVDRFIIHVMIEFEFTDPFSSEKRCLKHGLQRQLKKKKGEMLDEFVGFVNLDSLGFYS